MKLLGATGSHVGNVREANQDRVFFRGLVAALADGMGGHQGGERAAELAITEFQEAAQDLSESDLVELVLQANRQVHGHAADNGLPGMGTTVVAMTLHDDNTITVANVGDSRAYWLRGDYMGQVTEDHSFVEDLVRQGRLTSKEALTHPQRNILTRAVGIGAEVEVDRFPIPEPEVGDRFLLCSDGLFNELSEDEILDILLDAGDPAETAAALIEATLRTPCRDNVTVAIVDLVEDDDPRLAAQAVDEESSKVVTAPLPKELSKSVLHQPGGDDDGDLSPSDAAAGQQVAATATLLRQDAGDVDVGDQVSSSGVPTLDPVEIDAEAFRDTAEMPVDDVGDSGLDFNDDFDGGLADSSMSVQPRSKMALRLGSVLLIGILAVGGFFAAQAFARSGATHVAAENGTGELFIYEGRRGGFLGIDPKMVEGTGVLLTDLTEAQQGLLDQDFNDTAEAKAAVEQTQVVVTPAEDAEPESTPAASSTSSQETGTTSPDQSSETKPQNTAPN
ncbi:MAG: PP2C family protein-serine/threonine phosphatase [Acidimicrobiales bacterium]